MRLLRSLYRSAWEKLFLALTCATFLLAAAPGLAQQPATPPQYVVQQGDNLSKIAKKLGYADPMGLARVNGIKNPNLIQVGQVLNLLTGNSGKLENPTQPVPVKTPQGRKTPTAYAHEKSVSAQAGTLVVASWYGANHAGKPMANGRPFDMYADTVAHRTLPMGTKLHLTNPANGRSAQVEVTDRGPFIKGRNLDVSYGVARKLGMVEVGVTKLRMNKG